MDPRVYTSLTSKSIRLLTCVSLQNQAQTLVYRSPSAGLAEVPTTEVSLFSHGRHHPTSATVPPHMLPGLAPNQPPFFLSLLGAGITGVSHHTCLKPQDSGAQGNTGSHRTEESAGRSVPFPPSLPLPSLPLALPFKGLLAYSSLFGSGIIKIDYNTGCHMHSAHVCAWKPEVDAGWLLFSLSALVFETGSH